jgi:hypothetical protein
LGGVPDPCRHHRKSEGDDDLLPRLQVEDIHVGVGRKHRIKRGAVSIRERVERVAGANGVHEIPAKIRLQRRVCQGARDAVRRKPPVALKCDDGGLRARAENAVDRPRVVTRARERKLQRLDIGAAAPQAQGVHIDSSLHLLPLSYEADIKMCRDYALLRVGALDGTISL